MFFQFFLFLECFQQDIFATSKLYVAFSLFDGFRA